MGPGNMRTGKELWGVGTGYLRRPWCQTAEEGLG